MNRADTQVLRGATATITGVLRDQHGEPVEADGTVTVDLTRADGTVIEAGRETEGDGPYTVAVTETDLLDVIRVDWHDDSTLRATTFVEVVGGFYWSVDELRRFDTSLQDGRYAAEQIRAVRREVEAECEHQKMTGCAWVPRFGEAHVRGTGTATVMLPAWNVAAVRKVEITTAGKTEVLDGPVVGHESGLIERSAGVFPWGADVRVLFEHGYPHPPPDLLRATMQRARYRLNMELTVDRSGMERVVYPDGSSSQITPPEDMEQRRVVSVYHRHAKRVPSVA